MALIYCPECGKEISDLAEKCPNCGYPIKKSVEEIIMNNHKQNVQKPFYMRKRFIILMCVFLPPVGIALLWYTKKPNRNILTVLLCLWTLMLFMSVYTKEEGIINLLMILGLILLFLGLPASIIITIIFSVKKKKIKIPVICIPLSFILSMIFIAIGGSMYSKTDEYKESAERRRIEKELKEEAERKEQEQIDNTYRREEEKTIIVQEELKEIEQGLVDDIETESTQEAAMQSNLAESQNVSEEPSIEIFTTDLLNSWSDYIGKKVTVSFPVGRCNDKEQSIEAKYDYEAQYHLRSYVDNYRQFEYEDYVTITGIVDSQYASYIEIKDAHIDYFGNGSQTIYEQGKNEYDERKRIEAEEYEIQFKENAQTPTYDDLIRYPNSYKEIQIKVKVKIVRIEPDGIIFDGDIEATLNGETVSLYDGRETKEPKLREGDSVTIYGYGKGTTTVKVKDVSGLIPKTVDKYDIPAIDIRYIEFN